ncbi:MAG: ribosome biogenesis GTPase YqeH [Gammaproteobacteria bacterium]|nr:ribosome biogenesis GTPase YqeH [Gammaproteobacteria bacterium]
MSEELRCMGCGSILQTTDNTKDGFILKHVLEDKLEHHQDVFCQRCFRIKHYNKIVSNDISGEDYLKVISSIKNENALVCLIVDIFDFSGSFLPNIKRLTGQNDVILAANKVDLLPQSVKREKILDWVQTMCVEEGLNVLDSILISSKNNLYIDELLDIINRNRRGRDVYVVGSSNVGKSKLINELLKRLDGTFKDPLTVSYVPNTTLNFVGFPLDDKSMIYDTPGVLNRHQYLRYLTKKSLKIAVPQKEIKPLVYQLDQEQTLFIGGLARFDFISGEKGGKNNVTLYFSNRLNVHRTKMANADNLYETKLYSLLTPPFSAMENLPKFAMSEFHIRDTQKHDIVISGLGFISLRGPFYVKVYAPVMVGIYDRKAII